MSPLDPLVQEFADPFDRLVDGALKLGAIDPAQTTDFTIIQNVSSSINTASSSTIGILVRNPEPFNDPKLPLGTLAQTLTLSFNGGPVTDFVVLFSKDRAKAFITNIVPIPIPIIPIPVPVGSFGSSVPTASLSSISIGPGIIPILTGSIMDIPSGNLLFTFQYMQYNGSAYVTVDTETVTFNSLITQPGGGNISGFPNASNS
jgi:hypothetical protein